MVATAALEDDGDLPNDVYCPILQEVMEDPVVAADGHTYERSAIEEWLARSLKHSMKPISPKTNQELSSMTLVPNIALRNLIAWLRAHPVLIAAAAKN